MALNNQIDLKIISSDGSIGNLTNVQVSLYDYDKYGIQLYDDISYNLNFQIFDIENLENRASTYSKTMVIPGTSINNQIFSNLFDIDIDIITTDNLPYLSSNVFFNKKIECELLFDSIPIKEGFFELNKVSYNTSLRQIEYEGQFYSKSKNFSETVGDKLLIGNPNIGDDLNFSMYDHELNMINFINSHSGRYYNTSTGYYYPVIDYVNFENNQTTIEDFRPSLYVKEIIDKIFQKSGYRYKSDFFDSNYFKSLIIPWTGKVRLDDEELELNNLKIGLDEIEGTFTDYTGDGSVIWGTPTWGYLFKDFFSDSNSQESKIKKIPFDKDEPDPYYNSANDAFNITTNTWTVPIKGNYRLNWLSTQFIYGIIWNNGGLAGIALQEGDKNIDVKYQIWKNNQILYEFTELKYLDKVAGDTFIPFWSSNISWNGLLFENDLITFKIALRNKNIWINSGSGQPINVRVWLNVKSGESLINVESLPNSNLYEGDVVEMNKSLPSNVKQIDFFKDIINMFNLVVDEVKNEEKKLLIEPRNDYYISGSILDWTNKVDVSNPDEISRIPLLINKDFKLSYVGDSDNYNTQYSDENRGLIYGNKVVKNPYLSSEGDYEIKNNFSPTPLDNIPQSNWAVSRILKTNDRDELVESEFNTRILFRKNIPFNQPIPPFNSLTVFYISDSQTTYSFGPPNSFYINDYNYQPYAGHLDNPYNPEHDLNFDISNNYYYNFNYTGMTINNVYNEFWKDYIAELMDLNSKRVTKYIKLSSNDIYNFEFSSKIWIDGVLYIVEKIYDWNPDQITKVDLLKLSKYDLNNETPLQTKYLPTKNKPKPLKKNVLEFKPNATIDVLGAYDLVGTLEGETSTDIPSSGTTQLTIRKGNIYPDSAYGIIIGDNNFVDVNDGIFVKGRNNYIPSGATNVVVFGDNNIVEDFVDNLTINGNNNLVKSGSTNLDITASDLIVNNNITNVIVISNDEPGKIIDISNKIYIPSGYTIENVYSTYEIDQFFNTVDEEISGITSGVTSGSSGTSGKDGSIGSSGLTGSSGTSGVNGTSGTSGINGTSGTSGTSITGVTYAEEFYYENDILYTPKLNLTNSGTTAIEMFDVVNGDKYNIYISGGTLTINII